ncbi:Uncharacterised protein [Streptococcus pneumoniae]|nr:Uncharacterised protein [Streptococcus pneumoniae]
MANTIVIFTKPDSDSCIFFPSFETRFYLNHLELRVRSFSSQCFWTFRNISINDTSLKSLSHLSEVSHGCFFFSTWDLCNQVVEVDPLLRSDFCTVKVIQRFSTCVGRIFFDKQNWFASVVTARKGNFLFAFCSWTHTCDNHVNLTRSKGRD